MQMVRRLSSLFQSVMVYRNIRCEIGLKASWGVAKLVKAPDFDSGMRRFESFLPSPNIIKLLNESIRALKLCLLSVHEYVHPNDRLPSSAAFLFHIFYCL